MPSDFAIFVANRFEAHGLALNSSTSRNFPQPDMAKFRPSISMGCGPKADDVPVLRLMYSMRRPAVQAC